MTVVSNGEAEAVIVLPDVAGRSEETVRMESQAAGVLADFIQRMSGAKLPVVYTSDLGEVQLQGEHLSAANKGARSFVLIGDSALTRRLTFPVEATKPGATYIRTSGNTVLVMGGIDGTPYWGGAVYSAHALLESLGCRYLWPGQLGLVIPARRTITIPAGTTQFVPPIPQRKMRMSFGYERGAQGAQKLGFNHDEWTKTYAQAGSIDPHFVERGFGSWEQWQKLGGDTGIVGGHIFGALWDEQGKAHPGWFALQPNGSREQHSSERARLCVSNFELIAYIADGIIAKVKADPTIKSVSLSPNDGGADTFCMCNVNALGEPGCTTLDSPKGRKIENFRGWNRDYVSLTDRYVYFWNKIAERVVKVKPDLLFVVDAYSYYEAPPVERALHPNLVVRYIQATTADWDEWSRKVSKIYWRPNILHTPWQVGYLQVNRQWAADMSFAAHHGTIATDFDSILNSWATEGLNYYILARLNYNPDLNVDAIFDDYCQAGFGAASGNIRQYFKRVMALTDAQQAGEKAGFANMAQVVTHPRIDAFARIYTPQAIVELRGYLAAADTSAAADDTVLQRIAFLRVGLDWTDIQARAYRTLIAWRRKEPVDLAVAGKLIAERRAMMQDIFRNHTLAVDVSYAYFGDRLYWQALEQAVDEAAKKNAPAAGQTTLVPDEEGRPVAMPVP